MTKDEKVEALKKAFELFEENLEIINEVFTDEVMLVETRGQALSAFNDCAKNIFSS